MVRALISEMVETLVTSLLVQLSGSMLRGQPPSGSPSASAAWRRSFIGGFIETVVVRLEAQRAAVVVDVTESTTTGTSVALVLADHEAPSSRTCAAVTHGCAPLASPAGRRTTAAGPGRTRAASPTWAGRGWAAPGRSRPEVPSRPPDPGDPQVTAVYAAEDDAVGRRGPRWRRWADLEAYVESVLTSSDWSEHPSQPPIEVAVERRSRTATFAAASHEQAAIWIPAGHWTAPVVFHELAHLSPPPPSPTGRRYAARSCGWCGGSSGSTRAPAHCAAR